LTATIYYGDPPRARVEGERLTLLSGREAPVRDHASEQVLRRIGAALGLELGQKRPFTGPEAIAVAKHLTALHNEHVSTSGTAHLDFYETAALSPRLEVHEDGDFAMWFESSELVGSTAADAPKRAEPSAVIRAWERGEPLVALL